MSVNSKDNVFSIIDRVSSSIKNEYQEEAIAAGKKVIGYVCSFVPNEILTAAGALPFRVRATGSRSSDKSEVYFAPTHCSFVRHTFNQALSGEFDFLDGILFATTCDHARRMFDNWRYADNPPSFRYIMTVPHVTKQNDIRGFVKDLKRLAGAVSGLTGEAVSKGKLKEIIGLYNRQRNLLAEINELRKQHPPPITGLEMLKLHQTLTSVPVDEGIKLLEELLDELKNREPVVDSDAIRLLITSSHYEDHNHMAALESNKIVFVQDAGCIGNGHFSGLVDERDDPYEALAKRILTRYSCPHCIDRVHDRLDFTQKIIDEWQCDAMVVDSLQFCSYWLSEGFINLEECRKRKFPILNLNHELYGGGIGQIKTRIEAFSEQVLNLKHIKSGKGGA